MGTDSRIGAMLAAQRLREHLQFRAVDVRYALSSRYGKYGRNTRVLLHARLILCLMVGSMEPQEAAAGAAPDVTVHRPT